MIILTKLAGFLFLFILVLYLIVLPAFGYKVETSYSEAELQKINEGPKKFQLSIGLALIHNISVITLTIILFIVFGLPPYNIILGIVLLICRIGEGLILIYNDKNYWGFLNIARKYSGARGDEKNSLSDLARTINKTNSSRFKFAMILWSIGSLAFSIVLVTYGVHLFIGLLGIVASILIGFGNGIELRKPSFKTKRSFQVLTVIGGLSAIIFEVILGVFLLFF
ncbi:hypothetical protein LCGC14_1695170 [marine sediment metagenome]|uniref:DUF4386 domain-containing protein n=1 Tax=marine sediment metagenome TaxID=412755 RepID=A0A0F9HJJ4_9ZZZZ